MQNEKSYLPKLLRRDKFIPPANNTPTEVSMEHFH